jgi:hypothetical protein
MASGRKCRSSLTLARVHTRRAWFYASLNYPMSINDLEIDRGIRGKPGAGQQNIGFDKH